MLRYIETFFRNIWRILIPAIILLVVAEAASYFLIARDYESRATVWVDRPAYITSTTGSSYTNPYDTPSQSQANSIRQLLSTDSFVSDIVQRAGWENRATTQQERDILYGTLRKNITVVSSGANLISFSFKSKKPEECQLILKSLLASYDEFSNTSFNEQSTTAIKFYEDQLKQMKDKVDASTNALKDYIAKHPEVNDPDRGAAPNPELRQLISQNDFDRSQYDDVSKRLDQVRTDAAGRASTANSTFRVMDVPSVPTPASSSKQRMIQLGLGVGLMAGYALLVIVILTWSDKTMRSGKDVERIFHLPVLAALEFDHSMLPAVEKPVGKQVRITSTSPVLAAETGIDVQKSTRVD